MKSHERHDIILKRRTYDSCGFGNQPTGNDTIYNPFRYAGEYFDNETGNIYLRARYYNPSTGRFISEDPIRDGLNWYVYCGNDPINFWDPWGLAGEPTGSETYLRPIAEMYGLKIDVLDDRVTVSRENTKIQPVDYFYDTNKNGSVHGNRMDGKRMVVNTAEFGTYFNLTQTVSNSGTDIHRVAFASKGPPMSGIVGAQFADWTITMSYVITPDKVVVTSQRVYVAMYGWNLPSNEKSPPTITVTRNMTISSTSGDNRTASLSKTPGDIVYRSGIDGDYSYSGNTVMVLDRKPQTITAQAYYTATHMGVAPVGYMKSTTMSTSLQILRN